MLINNSDLTEWPKLNLDYCLSIVTLTQQVTYIPHFFHYPSILYLYLWMSVNLGNFHFYLVVYNFLCCIAEMCIYLYGVYTYTVVYCYSCGSKDMLVIIKWLKSETVTKTLPNNYRNPLHTNLQGNWSTCFSVYRGWMDRHTHTQTDGRTLYI